jgi:lysophospholipase L1-like esterase
MPLGDSITFGAGHSTGGGYRVELFHRALADGRAITFVGSQASGPATVDGRRFPRNNEGHPGYTIDDSPDHERAGILPLTAAALRATAPHIVMLMIGTNDLLVRAESGADSVTSRVDLESAAERLSRLLDVIGQNAPNALVVVARVPPSSSDTFNALADTYNTSLSAMAAARAQAGGHVVLVDMNAPFVANPRFYADWLVDGLHPNDAGYAVMGDVWYEAVAPFLR